MRKAVVRQSDGLVTNVIEIEQGTDWQPPQGCVLVDAKDAGPGDTWDGMKFIKPELPPPEPPRDLAAEIDELRARVEELEKKWASL